MITKERAIELIQKFDFFYGQRAGRELWTAKPRSVQDKDIANFHKACEELLEYVMETNNE